MSASSNQLTHVYILGPMTGYPQENRPAFRAAAKLLREMGFEVTSPDELDEIDPADRMEWSALLRRDIPWVVAADAGVALPGWRQSKGASLEATILTTLGRPIFELVGNELRLVPTDACPRIYHPM